MSGNEPMSPEQSSDPNADPRRPYVVGKTVIVTGASRGIGAAVARHLAQLGAHVVLAARSGDATAHLAEDIARRGGRALSVPTDVTHGGQVAALVQRALDLSGRIDLLVNNAGTIDPISHIAESDPDAWAHAFDVNVKGSYLGLRHVLPIMIEQGEGNVVNLSSGAANSFLEGWSHYCASKAAVVRLTGVAHKETAEKGVRVFGLSPGTVATDMQRQIRASNLNPVSQLPWEAHLSADWVARAVAFLMTPAADPWRGRDFSLKTEEGRRAVGMT